MNTSIRQNSLYEVKKKQRVEQKEGLLIDSKYTTAQSAAQKNALNKEATYMVNGRRFVVTPVFRDDGRETFGSMLLRLMKSEVTI